MAVVHGLVLATLVAAPAGAVVTPDQDPWVVNGAVNAVARVGQTTYLGGHFQYIGAFTGSGVPVSRSSGQPVAGFPDIGTDSRIETQAPAVNGDVQAVVDDGAGGWFVAGGFDRVAGLIRHGLVHIRPDRTVDPDFHPDTNGTVWAMTRRGSTLYVGGSFSVVGGRVRRGLAAIDIATGAPTPWAPMLEGGSVLTIATDGPHVYVGGSFIFVNGHNS